MSSLQIKLFPWCFKTTESFENLDNVLRDWANNKVAETSCRGIEQVQEAERRKIKPFLSLKMIQKKYSSSLNWQSSENKPDKKFVLVSREPLLYPEFNKPNKQNG